VGNWLLKCFLQVFGKLYGRYKPIAQSALVKMQSVDFSCVSYEKKYQETKRHGCLASSTTKLL
jgi:hypothetical protein